MPYAFVICFKILVILFRRKNDQTIFLIGENNTSIKLVVETTNQVISYMGALEL